MACSTKLYNNKNFFNHNCMNGLFLIVSTMTLLFPTHSSTLEAESNKVRCLDSITCTKCTINPMCVWSIKQQACENTNHYNSSSIIVSRIGECPKFSVVKKYDYEYKDNLNILVDISVEITNDVVGFIKYLNTYKIYYNVQGVLEAPVIINNSTIFLSLTHIKSSAIVKPKIYFTFIKFNDIMIRFDNVADHYFTVYGHKECATDEKFKSCATCGWNKNGYSNYLKWCSSENTCKDDKSLYLKNNATNKLDEKVAYVTNDCAEINVTAVNPLSGPKTGGTALTIIVRKHRIFVENRTVKVTVAGTVCTNPKTSGLETITCTTSEAVGALSGPVLVEYSSFEGGLKIESSQIFQFCVNPVLDLDQQLSGIASGGTSVPIRGRHFVEPCVIFSSRLYINLADGVRRYADSYCNPPVNDTYMVCRSPSVNGTVWDEDASVVGRLLNIGLDITYSKEGFSLNQSPPITVSDSSLGYYVHPNPDLEDFVINEGGLIIINGMNLQHVRLDDIVVLYINSSSVGCVVVSVKSKRIVCDPTITIDIVELHEILVKIGDSLTYILANRSPTPIVNPFNLLVSEYPSIIHDSNKTICSDLMTCPKCTIKPMCIWSLQQQICENRTQFNSSGLIVFEIEECPRFSVIKEYNYGESSVSLKYIVEVSNELVGFRNYLNDSIIYTRFPTRCKYPTRQVNINNNTIISCEFYVKKSDFGYNNPTFTFFTFIIFNDVILRFDNVADHYVTFYEQEECANDEKYKSCATCAWNKDGYSNYLRWCSSNNTCQVRKNLYMTNNGKEQLNIKFVHLTNDCGEINVTAVDPLSGPETGGTTMTITVRNHEILSENRTVIVTIAGTLCMNSRTLGPETITCITTQSNKILSGPILVEYSSTESVLKIESPQIFQFCPNPVLDAAHHLGGIASGGTSVPVRGSHFAEPCVVSSARLYVDMPDDVRIYSDSYCDPSVNDTYMVCRSPKVKNVDSVDGDGLVVGRLLNFGLEIKFIKDDFSLNQSLSIVVRGPSLRFYVHPDPVLLDFEINESGSVLVNGLHLQHVQPEDIVIRAVDSSSLVCAVVSVTPHSLVCEPTMHTTGLQVISVTMGTSLQFTVIRRTLSHPDDLSKLPGWFIALIVMSMVLVFVSALACCLRTKHRDTVTENICNPLEESTRSQDLYEHTAL
ncbi:unnamed protein product [Macrosiphum euphorbiae]|uniref:IPT/TIG domain-containing protein n=2 Tax=Macrosiphum euphorbiae TaxID=13131 RepID=A0AAV0VJI1_9HEMI|nr:unnamed protein product [Macrosiphum euphorbiae]